MPWPLEHEDDDLRDVCGRHHPGQHVARAPAALVEREVRCDAARTDVRAADAVLAQLMVERARQADLAEFRRAVHGLVRQAATAGFRGERDNVACTPEHVRQRGAHRIDSSLEIDVEHLVEVFARKVEERSVCADARVRDDDVDAAEALGRLCAEAFERVEVPDIARLCDDVCEAEVVAAPRREPEVDAALMQHARDCGADAAARAGDHGGLAFEHAHHSSFRVGYR